MEYQTTIEADSDTVVAKVEELCGLNDQ